jgi:hypothetical protein
MALIPLDLHKFRQANALSDLGVVRRLTGNYPGAIKALDVALAGLGRCALAAGRTVDAEVGLRQAWEIFQRIDAAEATGVAAELKAITAEPIP